MSPPMKVSSSHLLPALHPARLIEDPAPLGCGESLFAQRICPDTGRLRAPDQHGLRGYSPRRQLGVQAWSLEHELARSVWDWFSETTSSSVPMSLRAWGRDFKAILAEFERQLESALLLGLMAPSVQVDADLRESLRRGAHADVDCALLVMALRDVLRESGVPYAAWRRACSTVTVVLSSPGLRSMLAENWLGIRREFLQRLSGEPVLLSIEGRPLTRWVRLGQTASPLDLESCVSPEPLVLEGLRWMAAHALDLAGVSGLEDRWGPSMIAARLHSMSLQATLRLNGVLLSSDDLMSPVFVPVVDGKVLASGFSGASTPGASADFSVESGSVLLG